MILQPVSELNATDQLKDLYNELKETFGLPHLPLFFTYLGSFPEYLRYLSNQIITLAKDPEFETFAAHTRKRVINNLHNAVHESDELKEWVERYQYSPIFYNFQTDLHSILETNIKFAVIFISLREAIKGWAVAAKKLSPQIETDIHTSTATNNETDFVYEDINQLITTRVEEKTTIENSVQTPSENGIVVREHSIQKGGAAIERDLLLEYLRLCRMEFSEVIKTEEYLHVRVATEETMLQSLDTLPHTIVSPINVVLQYTSKYPTFPDLLYLLTEHFPTYAVQRMLFSAYMTRM